MKSDYYLDYVKDQLTEVHRILNQPIEDYCKELIEKYPEDKDLFEDEGKLQAYRNGELKAKVEFALEMIERREKR